MHKLKKYKIARRLGADVFDKTQGEKFALSEARKKRGRRGRPRKRTNFGIQLLEKQKVRYTYGISEKQFRRYVLEATRATEGSPAAHLFSRLERRLDNVVYRLGLAPTRRAARQLVSHGHIMVNDRRLTVPSHEVREGDRIGVRQQSQEKIVTEVLTERVKEITTPAWLSFDIQKGEATVTGMPLLETQHAGFNLVPIIEFYSR